MGAPEQWPQSLRSALSICLQSSFPTAIYWGSELRLLYNDAWAFIPGERHPGALGQPAAKVWSDIWNVVGPQLEQVRSSAEGFSTYDQMLPIVREGREQETYWNYSFTPIRGEDGSVVGVFNQGHETTSRVLEERRRILESERQRRLFQQAPGFITILQGPEHRFEFVNDAYISLFGNRDFVGKTVRDAFPELAGQGFYEWLDRVFATGERFVASNVPITLEGNGGLPSAERFLDFIYAPVADDDNRVTGIFCEGHDVTERNRSEAALRQSEERFRQLAETVEQGFYVTELDDRRLSYLSPAYERIWQRPREELLENIASFIETIHPDDRERVSAAEREQLSGLSQELHYRIVRPDGSVRWIRDRFFPVNDQDGRPLRSVGLADDITHSRQIQEDLHVLNETLEQRVAERTAELAAAQEALRQSQKLEAMGQLTGGVAHDFNNLLTPIIGSLDMLQRRGLADERMRRHIDGALQSAERAKTLVQRLLAFARRQPLQAVAVDLTALVEGMAELVDSTTGPQVEVLVELEDGLPSVLADANQVEMALLNLAVNSRDAMPRGGTLRITAASGSKGGRPEQLPRGDFVRLAVTDTGVGMDEATLSRAIEPFFSTKGVGQGTGLGLSMVHGLVSQLGGVMSIASEAGVGTSVELWLPVAVAQEGLGRSSEEAVPVAGHGCALVVDDEDLVRMCTAEMMSELGFDVVEARSGEDALKRLANGLRPDVLVTDHLMPGMTGIELAHLATGMLPQMAAVIVSGYAEQEGVAPSLPRLTKPFKQAELKQALANATASAARRPT